VTHPRCSHSASNCPAGIERDTQLAGALARQVEGVIAAHLSAEDWQAIDEAFAANGDPGFGADAFGHAHTDVHTERDYRKLFSRIVNVAAG
jgi:hypothetical protein